MTKIQEASYQSYRAPRQHGSALIHPSLDQVPEMIHTSESLREQRDRRLGNILGDARKRLIHDSIRYTSAYRETSWVDARLGDVYSGQANVPSVVMAGHQPSLFHPGVWFKNFALDRIGKQMNFVPINLVIDNDISSAASIRVPTLDPIRDRLGMSLVAYDTTGGNVSYEQSRIHDHAFFATFDQRVHRALGGLVDDPCVFSLWKHARVAIRRCTVAACALAQARHALEGDLGLQTLEIPMSVATRGSDFARFAIEILADVDRFVEIYNQQAIRYRLAHGIRSSAHPVPNLRVEGEWTEIPLWVYGDNAPQRRAVWVRRSGDLFTLSDRQSVEMTLDLSDRDAAAQTWARSVHADMKLRPRALLTTMYARWILSDLFLHGIGGGKYDQVGDAIAAEFFGIAPPPHCVMSATVLLPLSGMRVPTAEKLQEDRQHLRNEMRNCQFSPELFVENQSDEIGRLGQRKRELLADIPAPGRRAKWHAEVTQLNYQLSDRLSQTRADLSARLFDTEAQIAQRKILDSREHSFCIYPVETITRVANEILG
jgi:hypothetical protein